MIIILKVLSWLVIGVVIEIIAFVIASAFEQKPAPPNTDCRQADMNYYSGKVSAKEMDRRVMSGYYVKKDEEN